MNFKKSENKKSKSRQKGSALVEAVVVIPVLGLLIGFIVVCVYFLFVHFWLQYRVYEDVICIAEYRMVQSCESESRQATAQALPFGEVRALRLQTHKDRFTGWLDFRIQQNVFFFLDPELRFVRQYWVRKDVTEPKAITPP